MEWVFYIGVIFLLIDIKERIQKLQKNLSCTDKNTSCIKENNKNNIAISQYLNKRVNIIVNEDAKFSNLHLFSAGSNTIGEIVDYDDDWIVFKYYDKKYYNKDKKANVCQYIKVSDIESIDEVK